MSSRRAWSCDQAVEPVGRQPPAPLRIAPPGAAARAGRVDQHEIGLPRQSASSRSSLGGLSSRVSIDRAGALGARRKLRQPRAVAVGREDPAHPAPRRPARAPCRRRRRTDRGCARRSPVRRRARSAGCPRPGPRPGPHERPDGRRSGCPEASRMPHGLSGVGAPSETAPSTSSRDARAAFTRKIERRAFEQRRPFRLGDQRRELGLSHSGIKPGRRRRLAVARAAPARAARRTARAAPARRRPGRESPPARFRAAPRDRRIARNTSSRTARRSPEPA